MDKLDQAITVLKAENKRLENELKAVRAAIAALRRARSASVIERESATCLGGKDSGNTPSAERPPRQTFLGLPVGNVPDGRDCATMPDVVERTAPVLVRIERIREPEQVVESRIAKERTLVVNGVSPCVGSVKQKTGVPDFLRAHLCGQRMVSRQTLIAAAIQAGDARLIQAARPAPRWVARARGIHGHKQEAASSLIDVVQRIEMITRVPM